MEGEICVEPIEHGCYAHVYTPMLGYWGKPDATEAVLSGTCYRTGDVGRIDDKGWVYITDRRNDVILRGGANIYPAEVERVIVEHRDVLACAVVGRPHDRLGEEVLAYYEAFDPDTDLADELRTLCMANIAKYKVPTQFIRVSEMPRNQMGKISKPRLAEQFAEADDARAS
jgi:long-chain acyl-CoA synthetase